MEVGIKELGITLIVGAFTILGFEAILHFFFNRGPIGFFQGRIGLLDSSQLANENNVTPDRQSGEGKPKDEKYQTITLAFFVALAFASGILVENLSYSFIYLPKAAQERIFQREHDSRVWTLVQDYREKPDLKQQWWIAKDLARNDAFRKVDPVNGEKVQAWLNQSNRCTPDENPCIPKMEIKGAIEKLFYYAKNRVYADPNYYDELRKIQSRQEFARSLTVISSTYLVFAVLIGGFQLLWFGSTTKRRRQHEDRWEELRRRVPRVVGILLIVCLFSQWTFDSESDEFNKRIFGYFSSMLIAEKLHEEQKIREIEATAAATKAQSGPPQTQPAQTPQTNH